MTSREEILTRAMLFPMEEVLERYAEEQNLPLEVACEHERELKRYLALCALNPTSSYGMRGPIDELWHTFVIFTEKYASFCQHVAGRFLHHIPNTSARIEQTGQQRPLIREGYIHFLEAYESTYAEAPPVHLWPRPMKHEDPGAVFDGCGCTTCSCVGGGCNCSISIARPPETEVKPVESPEPEITPVEPETAR